MDILSSILLVEDKQDHRNIGKHEGEQGEEDGSEWWKNFACEEQGLIKKGESQNAATY